MDSRRCATWGLAAAWIVAAGACGSPGGKGSDAADAVDAAEVATDAVEVATDPGPEEAASTDVPDVPVESGPGLDDPPYTRFVDPFIGTGGNGFNLGSCLPGATAPFGLVKASPDTRGPYGIAPGFQHAAGYFHDDELSYGITHDHMHGSGGPEYGHVAVFPATGMTDGMIPKDSHLLPFTHDGETAVPGYYAMTVGRPDAATFTPLARHEVTATTRCAHHRIRFLGGDATGTVVLDAAIALGDVRSGGGEVTIDAAARAFEGWDHNTKQNFDVFFAGRFSRPFASFGTWVDGTTQDGRAHVASATDPSTFGGYAAFDTSSDPVVELQLCLSYVSVDGARKALAAEMPAFDFDGTAAATLAAWERELSGVALVGGTDESRRNFYTALYHAMQVPTTWGDIDGTYRGFDHQAHPATDWTYYTDMSLWDTFRTEVPLITLLWPDRQRGMMRSLAAMKAQGEYVPKWALGLGDTGSMIGEHAASAAVDAWLKGVRDFDMAGLYEGLKQTADGPLPAGSYGGRGCIQQYLDLGYCPADESNDSVSLTVEYAFNDYCLAQLATSLGHDDDAARWTARAGNWANHWDGSGFLMPRNGDRSFDHPDTEQWDLSNRYYVEGSAWQWSTFVPHDQDALRAKYGSDEAFVSHLDAFFEGAEANFSFELPNGWYCQGNEPDIHAPFLFIGAGRPDLAQKWARWALQMNYRNGYDGLSGNDDGGTMAAWFVFTAIGLYPWPCFPGYYVTAPSFDRATVRLAGGVTLSIVADGAGAGKGYVKQATFNGKAVAGSWIPHADLIQGGTLELTMSETP